MFLKRACPQAELLIMWFQEARTRKKQEVVLRLMLWKSLSGKNEPLMHILFFIFRTTICPQHGEQFILLRNLILHKGF